MRGLWIMATTVLVALGLLGVLIFSGCTTAPKPTTPFWYRIYEVDPQTGEAIGKTYTCHLDEAGKTKCWEEVAR